MPGWRGCWEIGNLALWRRAASVSGAKVAVALVAKCSFGGVVTVASRVLPILLLDSAVSDVVFPAQ